MLQEDISKTNDSFERYKERISNFSGEFELGLFLFIARRNFFWILAFIGIALGGAYLYLRYTPPVFESSSTIQIQSSNQASKILNVNTSDFEADNTLAEGVELLRSKVFFKRVIEKLHLDVRYFSEGTFKNNELYTNSPFSVDYKLNNKNLQGTKIYIDFTGISKGTIHYTLGGKNNTQSFIPNTWCKFPDADFMVRITNFQEMENQLNNVKKNSLYFILNSADNLVNEHYNNLDVKILNESAKTIQIGYKDFNPAKAADIVTKMTEEFKTFDIERKGESSKSVLEFIDSQLDVVYDRLKISENSLQEFKKTNDVGQNKDLTTTNATRLNGLEDQIISLELEESVLDKISHTISNSKSIDTYSLLAMISGTEAEGAISNSIDELHKLLVQKEEMLYEATPSSEAIKAIDFQIDIQKRLLKEGIVSIKNNITLKKEELKSKTQEFESRFKELPEDEVEYARLQRLFSINEKYYTLLLEKKTEYSISKAGFVSQNEVLEKAEPASTPASPNRKVTFIVFFLAAILLSLLLVLFQYLSHNEINSLNEITKHTHASITILGIVPKCSQEIPVSQLLVNKNPKSLVAESFRSIRSNLQFISNSPGAKVIALTSTISGEGKTFVAINLAGIIAFSGKKVVILDLDMRKPKIHVGFSADNSIGMSTLLIGKNQLNEAIHHSNMENLDFITAGPIPPNPSELIISNKMQDILTELKKIYEIIIIDNPPVGLVSDGISMIQQADYPIYIFRADYSKRSFIQNVDRLFNENNIKKLSVILNGVDIERKNYGYNYGYGYGYGYGAGYGYYEDGVKSSREKKSFFKRLFS